MEGFLFHIYSYFNYNRNRCYDCQFETNSDEQATFHGVSTGHNLVKVFDNYIESISSQILADCYKAASQSCKQSFSRALVFKSPKRLRQDKCISSCIIENSSQQLHPSSDAEVSCNREDTSRKFIESEVDFDISQRSLANPMKSRFNISGEGKRPRLEPERKRVRRTGSSLSKLGQFDDLQSKFTESVQRVACRKCGLEVDEAYLIRRTHVLGNHCSDKSDPEISELLSAEMRICFPSSIASSDHQCNYCGKEVRERSRRSHVLAKHFNKLYPCVIKPCTVSYRDFAYLKEHIAIRHGRNFLSNSSENTVVWNQLEEMRKDFVNSLSNLTKICFPYTSSTITVNSRMDDNRGLPRASACEKIAHILKDATTHFKSVTRSNIPSLSPSSASDSSDDVQILEETINKPNKFQNMHRDKCFPDGNAVTIQENSCGTTSTIPVAEGVLECNNVNESSKNSHCDAVTGKQKEALSIEYNQNKQNPGVPLNPLPSETAPDFPSFQH